MFMSVLITAREKSLKVISTKRIKVQSNLETEWKQKLKSSAELTRIFLPYTDAYWESSRSSLQLLHLLYEILYAFVTRTLPKVIFHIASRITRKNTVCKLPTERTCEFSFVHWKPLKNLVILKDEINIQIYDVHFYRKQNLHHYIL